MPAYQYAIAHEIHTGNALAALRLADRAKARVLLDMLDGGEPGFDTLADPQERDEEQTARDEVSHARLLALTKPARRRKRRWRLRCGKRTTSISDFTAGIRNCSCSGRRAPEIQPADLSALTADRRNAVLSYFVLRDSVALFVVRGGD